MGLSISQKYNKGFTLVELMIVIAIIGILAAVWYPVLSTYLERARVASIHSFVREMKLKWETLARYDFESIDIFGWVRNIEGSAYNLIRVSPRFGWPEVSVSWVLSLPMLGQAWYYEPTTFTRTTEVVPLSGSDFIVMHWIQTNSTWWQTYTVLNTWNQDGFRFGINGGFLWVLAWTSIAYYENSCWSVKKINDGRWHHIAGYFQLREWKITCYYDGKEISSVNISATYANFTDAWVYVGNGLLHAFSGSIDDVIIIRALD